MTRLRFLEFVADQIRLDHLSLIWQGIEFFQWCRCFLSWRMVCLPDSDDEEVPFFCHMLNLCLRAAGSPHCAVSEAASWCKLFGFNEIIHLQILEWSPRRPQTDNFWRVIKYLQHYNSWWIKCSRLRPTFCASLSMDHLSTPAISREEACHHEHSGKRFKVSLLSFVKAFQF